MNSNKLCKTTKNNKLEIRALQLVDSLSGTMVFTNASSLMLMAID